MSGLSKTVSVASFVMALVVGTAFARSTSTDDTTQSDATTDTATETTAPAAPSPEGLMAWEGIYKVFNHPRCANCHTPDEHPRWSGPHYGETRIHGMNVKRGEGGSGVPGLSCTTCHGAENSAKLHGPPGDEVWHLAPVEMVWWKKSSAEICEQIKDPESNGGRTLEEVAVHVRDDGLVAWAWDPGPGREPAPGSAQETYDLLVKWTGEGAPCPAW